MQTVDQEIETIHVYMVREEEKQPYTALPLVLAFLCLVGIVALTFYSGQHPYYEHERLTVPAQLLPPQTFQVTQPIIPTGVKTYPATTAYGVLTITNGSIIGQSIPAGFSVQDVVTDDAVYVPAGSANGYGMATVSAHAVAAGKSGNIPANAINSVVGASVYIRNLSPFTGGQDTYSIKFATAQDKQTALLQARGILLSKSSGLHAPCTENHFGADTNMVVIWHCRFVQPPRINIPNARITGIKLLGKNLLIDVIFIAQPQRYWAK